MNKERWAKLLAARQKKRLAEKKKDPEYSRKLSDYSREYKRNYPKRRKEQDGHTPDAAYYHRKKHDPEFQAKQKLDYENHKHDPKKQACRKKYYREVIAPRNQERRQSDRVYAEQQRLASRQAYAKRKADPVRFAAFLAANRERNKKYSRLRAERLKDPEWRERGRQQNRRIHERRKADPVRYAAYLAYRREYQRQWKRRRKVLRAGRA